MGDGEMPKEIIRDDAGAFDVQVAWGRDSSHVQVASVTRPVDDEAPRLLVDLVESWGDDTRQMATGLFCTLDRHHVNQLIRALRKARDQAFGKDE